jgi:hypothetical protein
MKNFGIETPCSEDWTGMTPSEKGAFCQKCAKQVHDFSTKSVNEMKSTLLELSGESLCVRMTVRQERQLNSEFNAWISAKKRNPQQLFIAALLIVFGLTLFSCEDERDQQKIESVQQIAYNIASDQSGKIGNDSVRSEEITMGFLPPPVELIEMEEYTMGAYEMPYIQAPPPEQPVEIIEPERLVLGGGSAITSVHREFLEQTAVELDENGVPYPTEFKAFAFPNPAVESTTLEIQAPEKERMQINLYDTSGKFIREIHSGKISRGTFRQVIDLNDLPSGLYLVIVQSKAFKETVRIVKQ